jgi:hypothetical protein
MAGCRSLFSPLVLAAMSGLGSGCAAIVDPSCGPREEVCRPIHCPPPCGRENCLDRFSGETWYQCPHLWRHCCPPLCPSGFRRQTLRGASEVFSVPERH